MVVVTSKNKVAANSFFHDESLWKRRRKLDGLTIGGTNENVPNGSPIIVQILFRRNVKVKFVTFHNGSSLL